MEEIECPHCFSRFLADIDMSDFEWRGFEGTSWVDCQFCGETIHLSARAYFDSLDIEDEPRMTDQEAYQQHQEGMGDL